MEKIHNAALKILNEIGMKIESEKAIELLRGVGCIVDKDTMIVRFPPTVVQTYVDKMRRDYSDETRKPARMAVRYSHVRFRTEEHKVHRDFTASSGGFCCSIYDLDGNRRIPTMDDVHRSILLVNKLDGIDYTGLPVSDQQTDDALRPVAMAAELAKYTTKFGGVETFTKEDIPYVIEIGSIVKGGLEELKAEPILVGYGEARSPLCLDRNMVEIFMDYIERGFPQILDTMPCGGASAPVTTAGILALGIAESLSGVVLGYSIDEDAVIGLDVTPSYVDMTSGIFQYGSVGRMPLLVARVQMVSEYYGCPSGVHGGKTDSCFVNVQCGIEKAMSTVFPVLAGAVGIGTLGHIENAMTFSPQQLVIDNEVICAVRKMLRPIVVNDATLAIDVIRDVGIGGNFLGEPHTVNNFREELLLSDLFESVPWESAHSQSAKGMDERALRIAAEIWREDPEPIVDTQKLKQIDRVVADRKKSLQ